MGATQIRHLVLDRDGVVNRESPDGSYVGRPEDFHWIPGAIEALTRLSRAGFRISVATNQSGVGRGIITRAQLDAVHRRMHEDAHGAGFKFADLFVCPHSPDAGCRCRKPAPGLIRDAVEQSGIAAENTLVVGDAWRDLQAAWRAGVNAVLVRTGKGRATELKIRGLRIPVYNDLSAVADAILTDKLDIAEHSILTVHQVFAEHAETVAQAVETVPVVLEKIVLAADECLRKGGKILACGNGGSASDAQHFVAELVGRFRDERRALPAITLTADPATITAIANDYGYENVFARQVEALARPGDLLFAISTSGNSANVLRAAETARRLGCTVVAMTGGGGGKLAAHADFVMCAPSTVVARIQEIHILCIHAIAESLDVLLR